MPGLEGLPAEWQGPATAIFIICVALFAAWARVFGKKEGPPAPKVQEFYAAGSLADMGPVKELVEGVGLLVQQQVKTNLQLEANAAATNRLADIAEQWIDDQRRDQEIAEEVARQLKETGSVVPRRRTSPKP